MTGPRFTLRSLMLAVAVAAISAAVFIDRSRSQPTVWCMDREKLELKESALMDRTMPNGPDAFTRAD